MKRRVFYAAVTAAYLMAPLTAYASDLPIGEDGTDTGSISENTTATEDGSAVEIPGFGSITQDDIDELAGYTRQATGEFLDQNNEKPMIIIREPDLELTYEASYERYRYTLPDGQWIECNVPQGAFCRGTVDFNVSEGITGVTHYRDGDAASGKGPFQECGSYVMTFWDLNVFGDVNRAYRVDYCFTIYSDYRMNLSHIEAPDGMEVAEVWKDGMQQMVTQNRYVQALEDGEYHIVFSEAGKSYESAYDSSYSSLYTMDFIRDTTPPVIEFIPEYRYGEEINSEVNYRIPEPGSRLTIYRNYVEVELPSGNIPVNGDYKLHVADSVGNTRVYAFSVKAPVKVFTPKMLLIPLALLVAAVIAGAYWRRNMRVL